MASWKEIRLRDICDSVDYGLTASAASDPVGPRFLRITDIVGGSFSWQNVPFVEATAEQASKYRLLPGDIVIARTGATTGHSRWIDNPPEAVFASYLVRLKISSDVDSRFVGYLLKSDQFMDYVRAVTGDKSAQPNASASTLTNAVLTIPKEKILQQGISAVLGALDDKIAVSERIAATTRGLGLALFTQALLDEDPLETPVASIASTLTRGVTPKYSESPDDLIVLNQKCIRGGRVNLEPSRLTLPEKVKAPKLLQLNDVLVNSTGVGTLGRVARWTLDVAATVDSHITIVRFDNSKVDPVCAGFAMLQAQPEIEALGEGSTGQTELSRSQLGSLEIILPSPVRQRELRKKLDSLEEQADHAIAESAALAKLRDTLLPQLMSGRLRVRDAEKIVEDEV